MAVPRTTLPADAIPFKLNTRRSANVCRAADVAVKSLDLHRETMRMKIPSASAFLGLLLSFSALAGADVKKDWHIGSYRLSDGRTLDVAPSDGNTLRWLTFTGERGQLFPDDGRLHPRRPHRRALREGGDHPARAQWSPQIRIAGDHLAVPRVTCAALFTVRARLAHLQSDQSSGFLSRRILEAARRFSTWTCNWLAMF
jgi:hypothetical protein